MDAQKASRLNLNTILLVLGVAAEFGPDVAGIAEVAHASGVGWLVYVSRGLGAMALLLSSLPRIIGRLRPALAALNLATPQAAVVGALPASEAITKVDPEAPKNARKAPTQ
jgi:hypothetical protein